MIFEQVATGGCQSYLVGCGTSYSAAVIDPEVRQIDRYQALAAQHGLRIRYVIDTHTHADHFTATKQLGAALGVPVVMHRLAPAPFVDMRLDEGDMIKVGNLRLRVLHTPGHTRDSMCLVDERSRLHRRHAADRRHRPHRSAHRRCRALYDSLFNKLLKLDPALQGLSGARLQGPHLLDDRRGDAPQPAPAEARPRRVRRDDARAFTCRCPSISPRRCA